MAEAISHRVARKRKEMRVSSFLIDKETRLIQKLTDLFPSSDYLFSKHFAIREKEKRVEWEISREMADYRNPGECRVDCGEKYRR